MRQRSRGFTLLEAIVALTILAAALLGAYAWVATDLGALGKVRDLALEEAAIQQAISQLEQTDLAERPTGRIDWQGYRIDWQAEPLEPTRDGRTAVGGRGVWNLTLYRIQLDVMRGQRLLAAPELRLLQQVRVRELEDVQ
jgi:general secretion pathway protein I